MRALVIAAQEQRLRQTYHEFFDRDETRPAVEFFFGRLYQLEGKQARDELIKKSWERFRRMVPSGPREKIERLFQLNDLTDELDQLVAKQLAPAKKLTIKQFERAYARCDNRGQRLEQYELLLWVFETYYNFSRKRAFKIAMAPVRTFARVARADSLIAIIDEGYGASTSITPEIFAEFLGRVRAEEKAYIDRLLPEG